METGKRGRNAIQAGSTPKVWQLRIGSSRYLWGVRSPNPTLSTPTWDAGRSSNSIWLWKSKRIASEWDKDLLETQKFLLRGSYTDLPIHKLTHSSLKYRKSSLKNTRDIQEGPKLHSYRVRNGGVGVGQCSPKQKCWQVPLFLCWALLLPRQTDAGGHQIRTYYWPG